MSSQTIQRDPTIPTQPEEITHSVHASGSFDIPGPRGGVVDVYFCNRGFRVRNGFCQDRCAHRSRSEALRCSRKVGPKGKPATHALHVESEG